MRNISIVILLAALIMVPGISAAQMRGDHPMMGGPMAGCPWMPDYMGRMQGMMGDMRGMMNMPMTP